MQTSILSRNRLPSARDLSRELSRSGGTRRIVVLFDSRLEQLSFFTAWLSEFECVHGVSAGEEFKSIDRLPELVRRVLPDFTGYAASECALVVVGGGSLGDAGGFLASVIKRGIGLVIIPTTWLAAIDSAYGGKTALNVDSHKNQIGTFYPARAVYLVREVLIEQPKMNLQSGLGEAIKMALITGGSLFKSFQAAPKLDEGFLFRQLPALARAKMRVVKQDPLEKKGRRIILNLGHTLGHAIELKTVLPHGVAVQIGTEFAARLSHEHRLLPKNEMNRILELLKKNPTPSIPPIKSAELTLAVRNDKKSAAGNKVRFVFLKKPGRPLVKLVEISKIIAAAERLGWCKPDVDI